MFAADIRARGLPKTAAEPSWSEPVFMPLSRHQGAPLARPILRRCTYPLTAAACVKRVYTELAVIDVTPRGFAVIDMVPGLTLEELQARTDAPLQAQSPR